MAEFSQLADPIAAMRSRLIGVQQRDQTFQSTGIDPQEDRERRDAVEAFLGENEQHFVDYVEESVRTSAEANRDIREVMQECWRVYQEDPPPNYSSKASWQSRVTVPKPHGAVQFAMAAVRQAFNPDFLSIEDERNSGLAEFWRRLMQLQYNRQHAKFVKRFTMASGMGFAVGQSFEWIPLWRPGLGLDFSLVEPWKIHRDPDALAQESQSGAYWIHEEWQDMYRLKQGERRGRYVNTGGLAGEAHEQQNPQNYQMDQSRVRELRRQLWNRNRFRTSVLTREYWGVVVDKRGDLLHPGLAYTVAGRRVIALPRPSPYASLRWPGTSYSPLPNFLRFEGRSLLQSVRSLWYFMSNLASLHNDYLNWQVNPMLEINQKALIDQDDIDLWPGKVWLTRDTVSGQQVVRPVDRRFTTNEVLANKQAADQDFQRGTFVNDPVQGLPGFRQQITARESAQNLQQSMSVFSVVGENLDVGAVDITRAAMETIMLNITQTELLEMFSLDDLQEWFGPSPVIAGVPSIFTLTPAEAAERFPGGTPEDVVVSPTGVRLPPLTGTFRVSGLQSLLRDTQTMQAIRNVILPMTANPFFTPFLRPHKVAKAIELRSGLQDEDLLVSEEEAEQIVQQQAQQAAQLQHIQMQSLQQQQQLEQQKLQLDVQKLELDARKLELEAQKLELEARQAELEAERQAMELAGETALKQAELDQKAADLAKTATEIAKTEHETMAAILRTEADIAKVAAQIEKTIRQTELQERKVRLDERQAKAEMALRRQQAEAQEGDDD